MSESAQPQSPVFAAMQALDEASMSHRRLRMELAVAFEDAGDLDLAMQRVDIFDHAKLRIAARAFVDAVGRMEVLVRKVSDARSAVNRAQSELAEARRRQNHARLEELRIELEIDAASIWDLAGQFEAVVRARLTEHAKLAAEMQLIAAAVGEPGLAPGAAQELAPALNARGAALWNVLAGGVEQMYADHSPRLGLRAPPPAPPPPPAFLEAELLTPSPRQPARAPEPPPRAAEASIEAELKFDLPAPHTKAKASQQQGPVPVARIPRPATPAPREPEPSPAPPEIQRGRINKVLRGLAGMVRPPRRRQR